MFEIKQQTHAPSLAASAGGGRGQLCPENAIPQQNNRAGKSMEGEKFCSDPERKTKSKIKCKKPIIINSLHVSSSPLPAHSRTLVLQLPSSPGNIWNLDPEGFVMSLPSPCSVPSLVQGSSTVSIQCHQCSWALPSCCTLSPQLWWGQHDPKHTVQMDITGISFFI